MLLASSSNLSFAEFDGNREHAINLFLSLGFMDKMVDICFLLVSGLYRRVL